MAVRDGKAQPPSAPIASSFRARLVDAPVSSMKTSFAGSIELSGKPLLALLQNVRTLLLFRMGGLFLNVIP
jgi:hypothetical protein